MASSSDDEDSSSFVRYKRRTVPFGRQVGDLKANKRHRQYVDEIYLREMNIAVGGVGCAVWDASIVLARWIYRNNHLFRGKIVHELGAGVALPGIMAGRYAKRTLISDYVTSLVQNIAYNIALNTNVSSDGFAEVEEEGEEKEDPKHTNAEEGVGGSVEGHKSYQKVTHAEWKQKEQEMNTLQQGAREIKLDWMKFEKMSEERKNELMVRYMRRLTLRTHLHMHSYFPLIRSVRALQC